MRPRAVFRRDEDGTLICQLCGRTQGGHLVSGSRTPFYCLSEEELGCEAQDWEKDDETVAVIVFRKDGAAEVLTGEALQDYLSAENYILSVGSGYPMFAAAIEQYSDAVNSTEEAIWFRVDDDRIRIIFKERVPEELRD